MSKIAIISDYIDPAEFGGAARVAVEQATTLTDMGNDVLIVAPSKSGETIPNVQHMHWRFNRRLTGIWTFRCRLVNAIKSFAPDLTILHQPLSGWIYQNIFPGHRTRYFFHSSWVDEMISLGHSRALGLRKAIEKSVITRSEKVFVTSPFTREKLANYAPAAAENAVENSLGVRSPPFSYHPGTRDQLLSTYNIPGNHGILSVFRRLIPRTGVSLFLNAFSQFTNVTALIGGTGVMCDQLVAQAAELGIENKVRFLGYLGEDDMVKILQGVNAAVVPSLELEGFGLSTVEAMACGCPAVVTPAGNNPNIIRSTEGGIVSENLSVEALKKAIDLCLKKTWDKKSLSVRVLNRYNWLRHAKALLA